MAFRIFRDRSKMAREFSERIILSVCADCRRPRDRRRPGRALAAELAERLREWPLLAVEPGVCMGACEEPVAVAVQSPGRATYLFASLLDEAAVDSLVAFLALYRSRPDGMSREAERPAGLRGRLRARIAPPGGGNRLSTADLAVEVSS
jgi:predicted metal-binding protein